MTSQEYERRILDHLNTLWQARGTLQATIATALGLKTSQVSKRFAGRVRMSAGELMVVLKTLGIDPEEFFAGVRGEFHAELYLARLEEQYRRGRKYGKSDRLRDDPSKSYRVPEVQQLAEGLQELRLENANEACRQALDILRAVRHDGLDIGPRAECLTRVALGAIYRGRGGWGTAAFYLRDALRIAGSDGSLRGRVLQGVMSLAMDQGDQVSALAAVRLARAECARSDDWPGVGRSLVSQGVLFRHYGLLTEAIASYQHSLSFLPEEEWFGRFAAHHGLGVAHAYDKNLDTALANATEAIVALGSRKAPPLQRAAGFWLRGEILLQKGSASDAEEAFRAVLEIYEKEKVNDVDYALIVLRLASVFYVAGKVERIEKLTSRLLARLGRLSARNKLIAGSIAQLHGLAIRGELSAELIVATYREALKEADLAPPAATLPLAMTP